MDEQSRYKLVDFIKAAFAETPPPANGYVGYELEDFNGKHWRDVDVFLVRRHADEMWSFSDEGFRFYLPAILIAVILHSKEADVAVRNIVSQLAPPTEDEGLKSTFYDRYSKFTESEKQAIAEFVKAYMDLEPYGSWTILWEPMDILDRAIEFWANLK